MPQKQQIDYGNGCRGCFLTLVAFPVKIIVKVGLVMGVLYLFRVFFPDGDLVYQAIASLILCMIVVRIAFRVIDTFLRFGKAEKARGVIALDRDLRGGYDQKRK